MRFSEDGKTVSSFRIGYPGVVQSDGSKYTAWQTRDFLPDPGCFKTANSFEHLHLQIVVCSFQIRAIIRMKIDPGEDSDRVFKTISGPMFGCWGEP
jgi:hypothetical protein